MNKNDLKLFYGKHVAPRLNNTANGVTSVLASIVCVVVGMIVGYLSLLLLGWITLNQKGEAVSFTELAKKADELGFSRYLA